MKPKLIKTETDYDATLARIDEIMEAKPGTPEGDELELLSHLVELYEEKAHPIGIPTPVEAIRFRMDQQGLRQKDLCPYIGSQSKVSEVLNGKRAFSKSMITRLHEGLGIPLEVLLNTPDKVSPDDLPLDDWTKFPVREMQERGWINLPSRKAPSSNAEAHAILDPFFKPVLADIMRGMAARQHVRSGSVLDPYGVSAWRAKVLLIAKEQDRSSEYSNGTLDSGFMQQLVQLSYLKNGPKLAEEFLVNNGIHLVILEHLPRTFLDGAAMFTEAGHPVVALTTKHDRLDNFWFTLCHELGHVALHLEEDRADCFIDDLDEPDTEANEEEADRFAANSLIPPKTWRELKQLKRISIERIRQVAASLRVHPAIVAGRIRFERKKYHLYHRLLGHGQVRLLFGLR